MGRGEEREKGWEYQRKVWVWVLVPAAGFIFASLQEMRGRGGGHLR